MLSCATADSKSLGLLPVLMRSGRLMDPIAPIPASIVIAPPDTRWEVSYPWAAVVPSFAASVIFPDAETIDLTGSEPLTSYRSMCPAAVADRNDAFTSDVFVRRPVIEPFAADSWMFWPETVASSVVCFIPAEAVMMVVPDGFSTGPDK